jgi:hypothetical protein
MIFDTEKFQNTIANQFLSNASDYLDGPYCVILVYSGTQPSNANFIADWTTNYRASEAGSGSGTQLLCTYGNHDSDNTSYFVGLARTDNQLYTATNDPYKHFIQGGTATWAAIFFDINDFTGSISTDWADPSNSANASQYMLVPVTDQTGSGVVRLSTTTITDSAPTLAEVNLTFTVS